MDYDCQGDKTVKTNKISHSANKTQILLATVLNSIKLCEPSV